MPLTGARIKNADLFFIDAPVVPSEIEIQRFGDHLNIPWERWIVPLGQFITFGTKMRVDFSGEFHFCSFLPKGQADVTTPKGGGQAAYP
jgi:hypothetical protein